MHLGLALADMGRLEPAITSFGHAKQLFTEQEGSFSVKWREKAAQQILRLEHLRSERPRLIAIAHGASQARTAEDWCLAAEFACARSEHVAAARTYSRAFATHRELLDVYPHRYAAVCAAALAGSGRSEDAKDLSEDQLAQLRGQAQGWLIAEMAHQNTLVGMAEKVTEVVHRFSDWLDDTDLAGVRDEEALKMLPAEEAERWRAVWRDVRTSLALAKKK